MNEGEGIKDAAIIVRFTVAGVHSWLDAPMRRDYLSEDHRHIFHVEVRTEVRHDDREIEFHDLIDEARLLFKNCGVPYEYCRSLVAFGSQSCEMLARRLAGELAGSHGRHFTVSVFEDGECGAIVSTVSDSKNPPA